jgi:hypothetical protein
MLGMKECPLKGVSKRKKIYLFVSDFSLSVNFATAAI